MKGFPNQIADVVKLAKAYSILASRIDLGLPVDDDSYGEALLQEGVIRYKGDESVSDFLSRIRLKSPSNQSHRTTARGLKEIFELAQLTSTTEDEIEVTGLGNPLVESLELGDDAAIKEAWRPIVRGIQAINDAGTLSHPYQILLRLLAARPGTPRSLCPLVLEALDDSDEEFQRIVALRDRSDEDAVRQELGVTKANWDNAKKILPSIAEQLGDAQRQGDGLYIAETVSVSPSGNSDNAPVDHATSLRQVTAVTIAASRAPSDSDELLDLGSDPETELVSLAGAIAKRAERSHRHNTLVQKFAASLPSPAGLWEGDIDCLAELETVVLLAEAKTLDGTNADEVRQVRHAVGQLLYYEYFSLPQEVRVRLEDEKNLIKIALFEAKPSDDHIEWMHSLGIEPIWWLDSGFMGTNSTRDRLAALLVPEFLEPSVG